MQLREQHLDRVNKVGEQGEDESQHWDDQRHAAHHQLSAPDT